jgi:hypothetical protein
MRRLGRKFEWWGLFALIPVMVGLIVLDDEAPLSDTWHMILLGVIVVVVCVLAVSWVERNHMLVEREGADADALVAYRALPGTIEGAVADRADRESRQAGGSRLASGYDPLAFPQVNHSRSDDE